MSTSVSVGGQSQWLHQSKGELGKLIAGREWSGTSLGAFDRWPAALTSTLNLILPAQAQIVLFWGPDFLAFYNDAYAPTIGDKHPKALGTPASDAWHELWDDLGPLLRKVRDTGQCVVAKDRPFYIERHGGQGEHVYFDISYSPVLSEQGDVAGVLCIVNETTDRYQAIQAKHESEERLRLATDAGDIGTWDYDPTTSKLVWDARCKALFGLPPDAEVNYEHTFLEGLHPDDRAATQQAVETSMSPGGSGKYDVEYRTVGWTDGVERWIAARGRSVFEGERVVRFMGTVVDISQSKRAEQTIGELNRTLQTQVEERTRERDRIWQFSQDLLGVADLKGVWLSVNPAWTRVLGWSPDEVIGKTSEWLEHPEDVELTRAEVAKLAQGQPTLGFENRFRGKDGVYRALSWTAVPYENEIYCVARDVTDERNAEINLRETEDRLRQAQKMEVVGQLSGGIAHDFNNLLQIVTGNLETIQRTLPEENSRLRRASDNAMIGAKRAATLTQRLLAFSRRQPLAPKPLDPNKLVAGMSELLHRTLGEMISIETFLAPGAWKIEADANQLESGLLNLAINSRDAMPEGGKLTIETGNAILDRAYVAQNAEVSPGEYLMIGMSDTGSGISKDALTRVFEPFFTTKEPGKGTGLGLSMVYGFVKQSGGHIKIESELNKGTTVRIYLPRLVAPAKQESLGAEASVPEGARDETVLVCEDDDDVRAYSVEVLRELGYRVLEAHDGASALRLLERRDTRIDLLFTDVVLPGAMTGADLAREATSRQPDLPVLFTTGYARNALVHHGRLESGVELLTKPFTYADLAMRVRDVLDKQPRTV